MDLFVVTLLLLYITLSTYPSIWLMEVHGEGREDKEENVREGVDKLCNVRREGVVLLTPVYGRGAMQCERPVKN